MLVLPAAIGSFLVVNLLCALVALGLGFGAGVWFFGVKIAHTVEKPQKKGPDKKSLAAQRAAERAAMVSRRVADLAQGVASDVGDHAARMKAITAGLAGIDREADGADAAVVAAMDQIMAANAELQQRLEVAEKQLAAQSAEIKAHESEARTDSLTGLANRRAFDDDLKRRLNEWERKATRFTLVLLDIDFFKKFNDTHGHQVGDEVLRQVAKALRAQARDMDLPCRYGGEEFAVILPMTDSAGACILAERIRKAVEETVIACDGKKLRVTCSLGLSAVHPGDDAAKIIRRADDALYKSKNAGRNCGHWSDGTSHFPICAPPPETPTASDEPADPATTADVAAGTQTSFIHVLKRRVTESHRFGFPLSLMHLKIDGFESVVQRSKGIAQKIVDATEPVLQKALREMDVLARLENGEFLVMLPGNTLAEAGQLMKRIRVSISNCVVPLDDSEFPIGLRHGIAQLKPNETAQELLARARLGLFSPPVADRHASV
jgi:diguanylate cyclase